MKTLFFVNIAILFSVKIIAQQKITETVYFNHNSYNLTTEAISILEKCYEEIKDTNLNTITIIGHTDTDGEDNYNMTLSENRSNSVYRYFILKGINKDKIKTNFFGENKPIAQNYNEEGKQQNRRVEIIIEKNTTKSIEKYEKQAQLFKIASKKDTTLICSEGTLIKIKANSFVFEKTGIPISDTILISIKEFYKISDIILSNLSTTSNEELLETAGMIHITATANNENCKLKSGETIEIHFPAKKIDNEMQLFTGTWENESHINWETQITENNTNPVLTFVELMPTYRGGEENLYFFLNSNINYPVFARENNISGTVVVNFIIEKDGSITNVSVLKDIGGGCGEEAMRVVKAMPKWNPGKENGVTVRTSFNLPIKFVLNGTFYKGDGSFKEYSQQLYTDTTIHKAGTEVIMNYIFYSSELGWINCDKFLNISPKINYLVKVDKSIDNLKIVFDRYKSIMEVKPVNGTYHFNNVPSGEKITIVAIKSMNDKVYLAVKETETSSTIEKELIFQEVTMEKLKIEIEKFDKKFNK